MEIDLDKMMSEGCDYRGFLSPRELLIRMNQLLSDILKDGTMTDLQALLDAVMSLAERPALQAPREDCHGSMRVYYMNRNITRGFLCDAFSKNVDNDNYRMIIDSGWLSQFGTPLLRWFYALLRHRYRVGGETLMERILQNSRISAEKRALLCHAVFKSGAALIVSCAGDHVVQPPFWWYNRDTLAKIIIKHEGDETSMFIKHTGLLHRFGKFRPSSAMAQGVENDQISLFEMNRQLEGRRICASMLECLMKNNAARCFAYLLSHYSKEVFKLRSPQEWLFTVCRCAKEKLAVATANEIERQFPGIVASARDPWGNTLLWNTFVNENPADTLQAELIRLGCDPNAKNEWDLSYQLLKDNDPEALLKDEEEACHAV